jgi:hypothetical protein
VLAEPYKPWRSNGVISGAWVGVDLGAAQTFTSWLIMLDRCNVSAIRIQTSNASNFSPLIGNSAVTVTQDDRSGRYKYWTSMFAFSSARYVRVIADTTTTTDGTSSFEIGSLALMTSFVFWTENAGFDHAWQLSRGVVETQSPIAASRRQIITGSGGLAEGAAILTLNSPHWPISMRTEWSAFQRLYGSLLFFTLNDLDNAHCYLCYHTGTAKAVQPNPAMFTVTGIELAEAM